MNINFTNANGKDAISTLGFTNDQRKAYDTLLEWINAPFNSDDYKRALCGPGGVGKTYLTQALIKNCNLSYSVIGLAAPTHKACRVLQEAVNIPNVNCNTIQSDLGLRPNYSLEHFNPKDVMFSRGGRIKIETYQLYIIDEASMIPNRGKPGKGFKDTLENICRDKHIKILYIGDELQLAPVNESFSSAFKSIKTCFLRQIVRQSEDNPIRELLDLLRYDINHKTFNFLQHISKVKFKTDEYQTKGYAVYDTETFKRAVIRDFTNEELTRNIDLCKVICYTNAAVTSWNKFIRNLIVKDADKNIITKNDLICSYVSIVDQFKALIIKNSEEYIVDDIVNYVHPHYQLKGFMVRFTAIHGGKNTSPLFVIDHTDKFTIQMYMKIITNLLNAAKNASPSVRAARWKEYYDFIEKNLLLTNIIKSNGEILFGRNLDYGFAISSHKSQGSTYDTVFVDVRDIVYDKNGNPYTNAEEINRRLYVACSRARNKLYLNF